MDKVKVGQDILRNEYYYRGMTLEAKLIGIFGEHVVMENEPGCKVSLNVGVGPQDEERHMGAVLSVTDTDVLYCGYQDQKVQVLGQKGKEFELVEDGETWGYYLGVPPEVKKGEISRLEVRVPGRSGILVITKK